MYPARKPCPDDRQSVQQVGSACVALHIGSPGVMPSAGMTSRWSSRRGPAPVRRADGRFLRAGPDAPGWARPGPGRVVLSCLPGLPALGDRADLGDSLGGHGDDIVAGADADGGGWPVHQRAAPGLAAGGGDRDGGGAGGAGHQPDSAAITARIKATMVSRIPARSRAAACPPDGRAPAPSAASLTG